MFFLNLTKRAEVVKDSTFELTTVENRLCGYFCLETIFNLSHRVLTVTQIKVLEKVLDFALIQQKINEPELRSDFNEFFKIMRLKWHFGMIFKVLMKHQLLPLNQHGIHLEDMLAQKFL